MKIIWKYCIFDKILLTNYSTNVCWNCLCTIEYDISKWREMYTCICNKPKTSLTCSTQCDNENYIKYLVNFQ